MSLFKAEIAEFRKIFDPAFEEQLEKLGAAFPEDLREYFLLMEKVSLSGGKRVRPYLFFSFVESHVSESFLLTVAAFIELLHLELLIIDDVADNSSERHGVRTIHESLTQKIGKENVHTAQSIAIVLGVLLGHYSQTLLKNQKEVPFDRLSRMLSYYNDVIVQTSFGQLRDITSSFEKDLSRDLILETYRQKTALYTFEGPLLLAAMIDGRSSQEMDIIRAFSEKIGLVFQISDDLISIFSSDEITGKSGISDYLEGKHTLIVSVAMEQLGELESERLWSLLMSGDEDGFFEFISLINKSGARQVVEELMAGYIGEAQALIDKVSYSVHNKRRLMNVLDYLVSRES